MYAFVDQPVSDLAPGGRFLLWAMRGWIHAAAQGRCPPGQLAPGFAKAGALASLPPLHRLLAELNRCGRGELAFAPLGYERVSDDEAVLLQLWHDATAAPAHAQETLALLVEQEAVAPAFTALMAATERFGEAGLGPIALARGATLR